MTRETRRKISTVIRYTLLILVGIIMVYPLIWMVGATFKTNSEIFTSAGLSRRILYSTAMTMHLRATEERSIWLNL